MKEITFKDKIRQGINDLFYIWLREFRTTFRDQGVLIFFVLVPLVYPLIYGFIYTNAGSICAKWMPLRTSTS